MDLLCSEGDLIKRAYEDPVLLNDERVLNTLLLTEENYLPSSQYFKCVQTDIKPYMRKMVADWMLEVCEEQRCEEEVFPISMNYMDRFLTVVNIKRSQLQLLGATCMFIASKLKETLPLSGEKLVIYTDNAISMQDLMEYELLVLNRLKWDLSAVTPHDFLEQFLSRLPIDHQRAQTIKRHAQTFIALCARDFKFASLPPSMIAAGSVCAAASGLMGSVEVQRLQLLHQLHNIAKIDVDCLRGCQEQIEQALMVSMPQPPPTHAPPTTGPSATAQNKCENGQPTTPTDVRDVHY